MENCLYQYSVLSALTSGICHEGTTVNNALTHGNHGIGTARGMNGEIILVDGEVYHFPPDSHLGQVEISDIIPFVMMTHFQPTSTKHLPYLTMSSLSNSLFPFLPESQNTFISVRVDAAFPRIMFRVIPGQSTPRETLADLVRRQKVQQSSNTRGILFGFWSPSFSGGFNGAGFHLHFLSQNRSHGGHVIDFEADNVELRTAVIQKYEIELPKSDEFHEGSIC